jgi:opacity protein-like surface antigen
MSLGAKQYLTSPGRSIGRLAWVPARIAPFVGAGIGALRYDFHQFGDFIDFQDMAVFNAQFRSAGWTGVLFGRAGVDYSLSPHIALTAQGRYDWSKGATLSRDFLGFYRIDLSGLSTTVGLTFRF